MTLTKRIVCLANSRKLNGRCIAGKEFVDNQVGGWIRPVSDREHEEVSADERQYQDGTEPNVLDIIEVSVIERRPKGFQQENWLLDRHYKWERVGQLEWNDLQRLADPIAPLWINGHSTYHGQNDHVPLPQVGDVTSSLRLLQVDRLELRVFIPGEKYGDLRRRVQGHFQYSGADYRLRVTDPYVEEEFLAQPDGNYQIGESFLTVSLAEPYNGACYKLIAAILQPA